MANVRRFDLEDLVLRPGTYYNPTTEVVLVIDDSTAIETGLIDEDGAASEWVLLGDEPAIDEHKRDEIVEAFETRGVGTGPETEDDVVEDEEELEPDPDDNDF
jgi:hypothetical protein